MYFSYIGYDSASTMAEEVTDPFKSLPIGIVGSVISYNHFALLPNGPVFVHDGFLQQGQ